MGNQPPSIGRIVHYRLSESDVTAIRADPSYYETVGNPASAGQVYPAMIVRVWESNPESGCNLRVFLDGYDDLWATSRHQGEGNGKWAWPEFVPPVASNPR